MSVKVSNLTKTFGDVIACNNVNFEVSDDEIVVLLGPSGCGKTTTLRCIAGLENPDEGKIKIGGKDVTNILPKERDIAFVFQNIALFPHMTIRDNISFGLNMAKELSKAEINHKVEEVASLLQIRDLLDRKPGQLSGGQQQRAALGRAMVMEPNAFLLDEPLANLDANLKVEMRTEIHKIQRELETAMIFVTHDQEEAMVLGNKIILMKDGTIQQIGAPYSIYNDPANIFAARFIGSPDANFVNCDLLPREKAVALPDLGERSILLNFSKSDEKLPDLSKCILGIRPENLHITNPEEGICECKVTLIEHMGTRVVVYLSARGKELRTIVPSEKAAELTEGEKVGISFEMDKTWIFDQEGNRKL